MCKTSRGSLIDGVAGLILFMISATVMTAQDSTAAQDRPTTRHTVSRYSLILFNFDSPELSPLNRRVMEEFVYEDIAPGSTIRITGYSDLIGLDDRNLQLTQDRAAAVREEIASDIPAEHRASVTAQGVGENAPLYSNDLPEGRFYNRTVQIIIDSPQAAQ